jgi:hypothetical protein
VAKKLIDIQRTVLESSDDFYDHLKKTLSNRVWEFLDILTSKTNVYLFSGVIRNYFINRKYDSLRDIDFIIGDDLNIASLFPNLTIKKNSFGGYKIFIGELTIDLWIIKNTWGLNYGQLKLEFDQLDHLPNTTFFSFSSIIYSLNEKKFIIGKPFLRFLRDKKLDVVLETNPYPALCVVNSFYYSEKYNLKFSEKLKHYITKNYSNSVDEFDTAQLKHFGKIVYMKNDLLNKINVLMSN